MDQATTPPPITRALARMGEDLATWRKLRRLTVAEVADRAGVGVSTVQRLESGRGASLENTMRVARAVGVLDQLAGSVDPYSSDVGQLRSEERLPQRVRSRKTP